MNVATLAQDCIVLVTIALLFHLSLFILLFNPHLVFDLIRHEKKTTWQRRSEQGPILCQQVACLVIAITGLEEVETTSQEGF